jgi:hypothetical protein
MFYIIFVFPRFYPIMFILASIIVKGELLAGDWQLRSPMWVYLYFEWQTSWKVTYWTVWIGVSLKASIYVFLLEWFISPDKVLPVSCFGSGR